MRRERYLAGLANAIARWPWAFLLAGVLLSVAAGLFTWRKLEFKTSRNDLIGRDSEYWRLFSAYAKEFTSEEDYIIVVESDRPEENRKAVDVLVKSLLSSANNHNPADAPGAQNFIADDVFYRVDYDALKPWFLYYLPANDLKQIRDSIKDFKQLVAILQHKPKLHTFFDSMNQMLQQMSGASETQRRQMESFLPTIVAIVNQMADDRGQSQNSELLSPWANAFFSEQMMSEAEEQMRWEGYQTFRKGQMFIVLIHPRAGDEGITPYGATIPKLNRILDEERHQFPNLKINLTGEPVLDYDEMLWSQRDALRATFLTLGLIALIFTVGFRELLRPVLGVACMILVIATSLGWATLSVGHLNIITVTFAVMLLGLGIDLGIQLIARYEEELSLGADRVGAITGALGKTGASIITAGLTNAAAFFAMGLSGFKGVNELGVIAGGGMVIATAYTMLVLPALLILVHRERELTSIRAQVVATKFEQLLLRQPYVVLALCFVLTAAALMVGWQVRYDYNVLRLQTKNLPSVETEMRLLNADVESTIYASVVCDTFEQARQLQNSLTGLPSVVTVHSIAELIPEDQPEKAKIIRSIQSELGNIHFESETFDPADVDSVLHSLGSLRLRTTQLTREAVERNDKTSIAALDALAKSLTDARAKMQAVDPSELSKRLAVYEQQFYRDLESQLGMMAGQIVDRPMTVTDVPVNVRQMLIGKTGKYLVRVFPRENIWDRAPLEKFVRQVQTLAPNATGTPLGLYEFIEILQRGYIKAAIWAFLVIAIIVLADFRGLLASVLTLLPLVCGMLWMVGLMALAGIAFNPANIMVLPLMVGIGVAYGIYVVQRYRQEGEATFYGKSTGRAVILSALTTIAGFASLILGKHQGIQSLGLVMTMGVTACLFATLVMLPALLEVARRRGWKV